MLTIRHVDTKSEQARPVSPLFDGLTDPATVGRFEPSGEIAAAFRETHHVVRQKDSEAVRLVAFYRDNRRHVGLSRTMRPAESALAYARGKAPTSQSRPYPDKIGTRGFGAPFKVGSESVRWVEWRRIGIRKISDVCELLKLRHRGFYTSDDGIGGSIIRPVVVGLPNGRIMPGFVNTDDEESGVCVNFGDMRRPSRASYDDDLDTIARWAETLADTYAEYERDRNRAWQAGSRVAELESNVDTLKCELRTIGHNIARTRKATDRATWRDIVRPALRRQFEAVAATIDETRDAAERLRDEFDRCDGFSEGLESN